MFDYVSDRGFSNGYWVQIIDQGSFWTSSEKQLHAFWRTKVSWNLLRETTAYFFKNTGFVKPPPRKASRFYFDRIWQSTLNSVFKCMFDSHNVPWTLRTGIDVCKQINAILSRKTRQILIGKSRPFATTNRKIFIGSRKTLRLMRKKWNDEQNATRLFLLSCLRVKINLERWTRYACRSNMRNGRAAETAFLWYLDVL